jgi:hypothetical protein
MDPIFTVLIMAMVLFSTLLILDAIEELDKKIAGPRPDLDKKEDE